MKVLSGMTMMITQTNRSVPNRSVDLRPSEFVDELRSAGGWNETTSKDGLVTVFQKDGARYVIRYQRATSTGEPSVDYYAQGSSTPTRKIRLMSE